MFATLWAQLSFQTLSILFQTLVDHTLTITSPSDVDVSQREGAGQLDWKRLERGWNNHKAPAFTGIEWVGRVNAVEGLDP